ncbi:MAG: glycosyltransferase family 39 protein [Gammaproteobacteria bacterium]|nr:glycosyltransferase family 39 protein [Gammaproteobacteria bacterium]
MFQKSNRTLFIIIAVILVSRFISMILVPYGDTTEARYGEMARIMSETGDWITPFYDYGVPFWGKPPLSFWSQAIFFNIFGIHEFSARFPSWLASLGIIVILYKLTAIVYRPSIALISVLIFSSSFIVYLMSGAVLTDPYLALGTTLSLAAFTIILQGNTSYWRYLFFIGISLGMLAKGPVALILIGGPIGIWLLMSPRRWSSLSKLPWLSGTLLVAIIVLPWYIAAEMKTPGFLEYFILGEHYYRFVDPGWAGDLYGTAHKQTHGTIWLLWILAAFPWSIFAIYLLIKNLISSERYQSSIAVLKNETLSLLVIWAIFPMLFFTMAGNILITYTLPAIPPLSILLALKLAALKKPYHEGTQQIKLLITALFVPMLVLTMTMYVVNHPSSYPSEKELIHKYKTVSNNNTALVFITEASFSARFYSRSRIEILDPQNLKYFINKNKDKTLYYVATDNFYTKFTNHTKTKLIYESYDYVLFTIL